MSLRNALEQKEILVVCGSGGVGKTSVSAALALAAAADRKAIVVTIDPAKRLATSLGLDGSLGHAEREVPLGGSGGERSEPPIHGGGRGPDDSGGPPDRTGGGSMYAAMLDMKTAWDELIDRNAPSRDVAENIKSNRIYQTLSEHFIGSQGYMAMDRLAELNARGAYDLIVLDTPPTRHALDFLDAPKRVTDFVGGSLLRWFAKPYTAAGKVGLRAFNFTASPFLRIADRVLGSQVLEDLSAFVLDFQTMYDDFKRRAEEVLRLLHDRRTGFVVVTTLEAPPLDEAGFFLDRLADERLGLAGVVANRVIPERFADARPTLDALERADAAALAAAAGVQDVAGGVADLRGALSILCDLAMRDRDRLVTLERRAHLPVTPVPLFARDVHDLEGLGKLASYLLTARG